MACATLPLSPLPLPSTHNSMHSDPKLAEVAARIRKMGDEIKAARAARCAVILPLHRLPGKFAMNVFVPVGAKPPAVTVAVKKRVTPLMQPSKGFITKTPIPFRVVNKSTFV